MPSRWADATVDSGSWVLAVDGGPVRSAGGCSRERWRIPVPTANSVYVTVGQGGWAAGVHGWMRPHKRGALLVGLWALPVLGGSVTLGLLAGLNAWPRSPCWRAGASKPA